MKFLCDTEFYHSGIRLYTVGTTYELTAEQAEQLIKVDKKKTLGALSFFSPVDEEALRFVKEKGGKVAEQKPQNTPPANTPPAPPSDPNAGQG